MQKIIISILLLLSATVISAQGNWVATELEDPYVSDSTQYVLDDLEYLSDWEKDSINMIAENSGLETKNKTSVPPDCSKIYFYFTGDQCAITNIRINRK